MANNRKFNEALKDFGVTKLPNALKKYTDDVTMGIVSTYVMLVPVKTGHARANVQVTSDRHSVSEIEGVDPQGTATIERCKQQLQELGPNDRRFIVLTVPYGQRLEDGWSRQAPAGMAAQALALARALTKGRP